MTARAKLKSMPPRRLIGRAKAVDRIAWMRWPPGVLDGRQDSARRTAVSDLVSAVAYREGSWKEPAARVRRLYRKVFAYLNSLPGWDWKKVEPPPWGTYS